MCEEAANFLGCRFELVVNGVNINIADSEKETATV